MTYPKTPLKTENPVEAPSPGRRKPLIVAAVGIGLVGLWLTSRVSYPLFHSLAEAFSILVAWGMFIVAWNTRRLVGNSYFLLLGVSALGVGAIDLLHLLAYKGMGVFPGSTANLATQLWIAARYLQAGSLLLAPLFLTRKVRGPWLLLAYGLATGLLLAAVFGGGFPECFVEGKGLTPFKVASEYIICGLLAGGIYYLYRRRQFLDRRVWALVTTALVLSIGTEMAFTLYVDVYGLFNQIGHILKIIVFVLLYQGVVVSGLQQPFRTLFRELAQSEDRYRMLFDTMTEGFALHEIVTDEQGRPCDYRFLEVNQAFERLTGLKRNDLIDRRVLEVLPDTEPYWIETYGRVALDGVPAHFERFFPPLHRWYQVIAYRPHPGRFAVIFTDITERKQAEESLRLSQERNRFLAELLEHSDQPFTVAYPDGSLGYLNEAFERLSGYNREELKSVDWIQTLTPPEWREAEAARLEELQRTGEPVRYEKEYIRKDGSRVPIELLVHLVWDEQGRLQNYYSFITDLTERKQAEAALQASRLAALNLMEDAVEARREAEKISAELEKVSERLKRDNREVALYNRILKEFIEKTGEEVFAPVLDIILEEMASRHGVFGYIPEPGHLICPSLSAMLDECEVEGKCIHYPPEKWKGLWARALKEKRAFLSNAAPALPRGHVPIVNNLAVPILFRGEAIGLFNLANKETDYTEEDRKLLEAIAGRVAPVLYAWIQHKLREDDRRQAEENLKRAYEELEVRVAERTVELRKTVELVQAERKRFYDVLETLPAYLVLLTPDYHVPFANRFFRERFGDSEGRRCYEYLFGRSEPCEVCETYTVLKTGKSHQWAWTGPDGRQYDVYDYPFVDRGGSTHILEMGIDVTERNRAEAQLKESEQRVRFFASQCLTTQEQERKRIAGELHDGLASSLVAAKYRLERTVGQMESGIAPGEALPEVIEMLEGLNKEVRRIMVDLRPAVLDDLGLLPALTWFCREFEKTYGHIRVEKRTELSESDLAEALKTPIFRLTQEALNNVAKHSGANLVTLSLAKVDSRVLLIIRDNGLGFDPGTVVRGLGLSTMKERTELSGGEYRLESVQGKGTVLYASWPLGD
ncbi:MAG: PAS domain S-box protein [Deltaproteobacteria bacterium]|nr:PAS domain S-box protein [Deltaproteobacteria bacterium]